MCWQSKDKERAKARLVVQAMRKVDKDFASLFTYSPTVSRIITRVSLTRMIHLIIRYCVDLIEESSLMKYSTVLEYDTDFLS